jgi:uncharacterized protein involved in exopolysaccharide biosynthesis
MEASYLQVLLRKYSKLLVSVTLFVGLLSLLGSVVLRIVNPTFVSSCLILVYPSEEDRALLKERSIFGGRQDVESITLSKTEIILSRTVLETVARKLMAGEALEKEAPDFLTRAVGAAVSTAAQAVSFLNYGPSRELTEVEDMIETLQKKVSINIFPNSFILEIQARSTSAEAAYQIAKNLSETYVEYTRSFNHDLAGESRRFIETELSRLETDLYTAEDELRRFKEGEDAPQLRTQGTELISQEGDYRVEYDSLWATLKELRAERDGLLKQLGSVDKEVSSRMMELNPTLQQLRFDLAEKEVEMASLLEIYTEEHQLVMAATSSIATLREALSGEMEKILTQEQFSTNPVYTEMMNRLVRVETLLISQEARLSALDEVLKKYDEMLADLPGKEVHFTRLNRQVTALSDTYNLLQEKLGEARLLEVAKLYDIRIVEPPIIPVRPASPAILINVLLGLLIGFLLALAAVILLEYTRSTR